MSNEASRVKKRGINWDLPCTEALRAGQAEETGTAGLASKCSSRDINASGAKATDYMNQLV